MSASSVKGLLKIFTFGDAMTTNDLGLLDFLNYVTYLEECKDALEDAHNQLEAAGQVDDYTRTRIKTLIETKGQR